jgi:ATP-binding protein involved in chromosome partitioning
VLKIAVPTQGGRCSAHFDGADRFAVFEVDEQERRIASSTSATPPAHQRGNLPTWLKEQGCNVVLAGGVGPRAVTMLEDFGIQTVAGIPEGAEPEALVRDFVAGRVTAEDESRHGHGTHRCDRRRRT